MASLRSMRIVDCCISLEWNEARSCISNSVSFLGLIETPTRVQGSYDWVWVPLFVASFQLVFFSICSNRRVVTVGCIQ